jgi:hypothetical protein
MINEQDVIEAFEKVSELEYLNVYGNPGNDNSLVNDPEEFKSLISDFGLNQGLQKLFLTYSNQRVSLRLTDSIYKVMRSNPEYVNNARKLLGEYLLPMCGITLSERAINANLGLSQYNFCAEAENQFHNSYSQATSDTNRSYFRISTYHDENGEPLIFRKDKTESSALLLQDFSVSGIPLPAGTIVDVSGNIAEKSGEKVISGLTTYTSYESYLFTSDFLVAPGRISPWSHSNAIDKSFFAVERMFGEFRVDSERLDICTSLRLSDFRMAAERVIELAQAT